MGIACSRYSGSEAKRLFPIDRERPLPESIRECSSEVCEIRMRISSSNRSVRKASESFLSS